MRINDTVLIFLLSLKLVFKKSTYYISANLSNLQHLLVTLLSDVFINFQCTGLLKFDLTLLVLSTYLRFSCFLTPLFNFGFYNNTIILFQL